MAARPRVSHLLRPVLLPLVLAALLVPARAALAAAAASDDTTAAASPAASDDSTAMLAPTSDPPWNPPAPVPASQTWERMVRAPFVVAGSPFLLLVFGIEKAVDGAERLGLVGLFSAHARHAGSLGLIAGPATLGDRTGLGALLGWRPPFFRPLVGTLSASTLGYDRGRLALEWRRAVLEYQAEWRPEDLFSGIGPDAAESRVSNYATAIEHARLVLRTGPPPALPKGFGWPADPADDPETHEPPRRTFSAWMGPRSSAVLDGRERSEPDHPPLLQRFTPAEAGVVGPSVEHLVYGARAELDARAGRPHWWKGGRIAAQVERVDDPVRALALRSARPLAEPFTRWTWEGQWATSFWRDPRTLRFGASVVDRVGTLRPGAFQLTDLATLGGSAGLTGYEPGRFRDADRILGSIAYIYPVAAFVEMEVHVESGSVMPHLEHARLDQFHQSIGFAVRGRSPVAMVARVGLDWSVESTRLTFQIGGVE